MAKKLGFWVVAVSASAPPQDAGELPPGGGGRNPRYWLMRCTKKGFGFTKNSPWFLGWEFFTPQFLFRKKKHLVVVELWPFKAWKLPPKVWNFNEVSGKRRTKNGSVGWRRVGEFCWCQFSSFLQGSCESCFFLGVYLSITWKWW